MESRLTSASLPSSSASNVPYTDTVEVVVRRADFVTVCVFTPRMLYEFLLRSGLISDVPQNNTVELAEKRESQNTKKITTPIVTPVTPAPPTSAPTSYPPPFQIPFKNFRGTGESYAHPD
ncbi:hypothetical protein G6011_02758 [Alternaria panax]|uniref:Uncharacterized protein n=1 Tax=Alternaria panax TaxID=48097 RepID=A0AAD4F9Z0_9PLEO|nr:hypothetical protein G6011_02758 [Alternaria panax]